MAAVPQKTLNWLWDVLRRVCHALLLFDLTDLNQEYRDPQRAYTDLAQSIALFPSLSPRTDVYSTSLRDATTLCA